MSSSRLPWTARALLAYGAGLPNHWGKWRVHGLLKRWLDPHLDQEMEVARSGFRWHLNPSDHAHGDVFWLGIKDRWELEQARRLLPAGGVFLDIGSNFGWYALTLARTVGPTGQVHAFEPNPPTFAQLRAHVDLNDLGEVIRTVPQALSDRPGRASLITRDDNTGAARLDCAEGDADEGVVTVSTLDEYAARSNLGRVDLIKLDVEGNEPRVLRGGEETLARFQPPLLVEVNPPVLENMGTNAEELAGALRDRGYDIYRINRRRLSRIDGALIPPESDGYFNVLAWPRKRGPIPKPQ